MRKKLKSILWVFLFFAYPYFFMQPVSGQRYGPEQKIKVVQNFPAAVRPGSDFMIEIKIEKGNIGGLAKFQQYIAAGMTASAVENAGADFSFESQNVKFIWTSVPQNAEITLRYKITVASTLSGKKYLSGTFSYVENDRTKKISLVPKEIEVTPTAPAIELTAAESKPVQNEVQPEKKETSAATLHDEPEPEEKEESPANKDKAVSSETTPAITETKKQAEEKALVETTEPAKAIPDTKKEQPAASIDNVTAPASSGITFKVQIAAMNEKHFRKKNYFQEKFGLQMEVTAEDHEGLKKYTVGNFASYAQAHKLRDDILSSVSGSFVVAYKDGVRIPVPEAIEMLKKK